MNPLKKSMSLIVLAAAAALPVLLCTLAADVGAAEAAELRLNLEEAVAMALEKNEGLVVERASLASATAAIGGAQGAYDLRLSLEAGWRRTTQPVNSAFSGAPEGESAPTLEAAESSAELRKLLATGGELTARASTSRVESNASFDLLSPAYNSQFGFEFRQPLLRDRVIDNARLGLRVAAADRDQAAAELRREVSETVAAVEKAYWGLIAARREIEVRDEAVKLAKEQLSETEIRIQSGASPETEIAQPRSELERRRGEFLAAQGQVALAESGLKLLILADTDDSLWLAPLAPAEIADVKVEPVAVAVAMTQALESRPELAAAAAFLARRGLEKTFARDGIRPSLDLVVSYDRFGLAGGRNPAGGSLPGLPTEVPAGLEGNWRDALEGSFDGDFDDARLALVFEVPIGNRAARATAAVAENVLLQAEAELARARKMVRVEVLNAAAAVQTAGGRIGASQAAREAAEVQLAAERERFGVGLSTNFLVLTRQNDLSNARLDEIAAQTDYLTARTELGRATGSLLEARGIEVQAE